MKIFRRKYHRPGTAAGTFDAGHDCEDNANARPLRIDLVNYNDTKMESRQDIGIEQCKAFVCKNTVTWIHVSGDVNTEILKQLQGEFNLHPLALEDVINHGQRPKAERYDEQLFITMNMPVIYEYDAENEINVEQVSIFCGSNYVISFHNEENEDTYQFLHKRLAKNACNIRRSGSDYLLYVLLDLIIDNAFPVLEHFGERLEVIEESLMNNDQKDNLHEIHNVKRELILLRRSLWPQRDVLNSLLRDENPLIKKKTLPYLRDCYDHTVQIMELIESYRDMAVSAVDIYLSTVSFRLNEVMRFLTLISTIFIPPTFIVGIYGMNFREEAGPLNMPELSWPLGYVFVWGIIIISMISLLGYFKYRRWF